MKKIQRVLLRNILFIVGAIGFIIVIFGARGQLADTWEILKTVNPWALLLLPLTQMFSYFFLSCYYRSFLSRFGKKIGAWRAFGTTTALNFVNQILPSGGASGITYIIYAFKDAAKPGEITLIQLSRYVLAFLSYVPLLVISYFALLNSDELNQQMTVVMAILFAVSLPGMILIISALRNRKVIDWVAGALLKIADTFVRLFTRRGSSMFTMKKARGFLDEFHQGIQFLEKQGSRVVVPCIFIMLSTIAEVTIVNIAFWIIGADIDFAVLTVAFAAANLVGAISIIPGDIGVHELTVITVLSYVGVPEATAIAGTLLYRVFNKFLSMGIGFFFYVKYLKPLAKNVQQT